jgi:hypothetical protein
VEGDKAFLAIPYKSELQWVRNAIAAAARRLGIELVSVDEQVAAGDIVAAIHHYVRTSLFGYVVVTGLNPNVMYELGLLHQAAKPTIILADAGTIQRLPFDIQSLFVLTYDAEGRDENRLADQVAAATGQLFRFFDHAERTAVISGEGPSPTEVAGNVGAVGFSMAAFDFEAIKNQAAKAAGYKGCATRNIIVVDEDDFRGWRLKARCSGGSRLIVKIDLNGVPIEIDVEE